ncbi:MAG: MGDG synthase family glycosyltransferase [Acidimicrobiales bacterium]
MTARAATGRGGAARGAGAMTAGGAAQPRRVLVLSADMGEGHNAAAAALIEAAGEVWPEAAIERLDTVELGGQRFASWARWVYEFQLKLAPWSYQFFYDALCQVPWFAGPLKQATGWFFGRQLEPDLATIAADVVLSTYPLGSGAMDWMRRARGSTIPTATFVPAFHVHPYWAYAGVDLHFVMYEGAERDAATPGIEAKMVLGAPPVRRGFAGQSRLQARAALGIDRDGLVVLVTGGAWGLGSLEKAVVSLLDHGPPLQVVVTCGRNDALRSRLVALGRPERELKTLGYTDQMPALMSAADIVVTNGAGVTVLEALVSRRPVIAFDPLPGHGVAASAVMARLDLALVALGTGDLVEAVKRLANDDELRARLDKATDELLRGRDLRQDLERVAELMSNAKPAVWNAKPIV